ncbi:MAG: HDOD domain-containing protein [Deltaproteobacteria bacterium]|nr:HDOD domain-containing protein [Deltaproteobacteria bacterium]
MIDLALKRSILELRDLPTLPEVVTRIVRTIEDGASSAADVCAVLEMDHAISARVLRLANSAFYGLSRNIGTMRRAVVVIGFEGVRLLAMATSVYDALGHCRQAVLDPRDFWMHSFGAARAALLISKRARMQECPETHFTAGLLHDFGKYILALAFKQRYVEVLETARQTGAPLCAVERSTLHTTHGEVGAFVARRWQFPERLAETTAMVEGYRSCTSGLRRDVYVVAMADQLSCLAGFGLAGESSPATVDPWLLGALGLDQVEMAQLLEELHAVRDDTECLLEQMREG